MDSRSQNWLMRLGLVLSLSVAGWGQSATMPLGDVVKQPKPAKKAARIITNDDLPKSQPEPQAPASGSTTDAKASPADAKGAAANDQAAAEKKNEQTADEAADSQLAKRMADLNKSEAAEQKLRERLNAALQHSGMSEEQRQMLTDALSQSEGALAGYREQKQVLQDLLLNSPKSEAPAAAEPATDEQRKPEPNSASNSKPEQP